MSHRCLYVPPHVLDHMARMDARESLEPSSAQRSAVVSAQFRRARRVGPVGVPASAPEAGAAAAAPAGVTGVTPPPPASSGRLVYDDEHQWTQNVTPVRGEGDPAVAQLNADTAYGNLGLVRQYYKEKLGRDSIDDAGLDVVGNVNYGVRFDNAFWDPASLVMVFGNGSGTVFKDLTGDVDVAGHELTHGVTQFTAALNYTADQSGALNESFSDMLGTAIDAWAAGKDADTHNWLIGEAIMADSLYGEALRNMAEPGTAYDNPLMGRDPQPRDMSGYHDADPHIMSGITNRWFSLICKEIGLDAGTLIMYQTLQNLWPTATFNDAALVAAAQARILASTKEAPAESAQVVRAMARQQGLW
ncbi:MAG: M4 family metallopeptidase [Kineosporiaceae bacterium]